MHHSNEGGSHHPKQPYLWRKSATLPGRGGIPPALQTPDGPAAEGAEGDMNGYWNVSNCRDPALLHAASPRGYHAGPFCEGARGLIRRKNGCRSGGRPSKSAEGQIHQAHPRIGDSITVRTRRLLLPPTACGPISRVRLRSVGNQSARAPLNHRARGR